MEADICEENISLSAASEIDQKVSNNIDESDVGHSTDAVENENVTNKTVTDADDKSQNSGNSLSNNQEDDYYDVVSPDGSFGGDDIDNANDIGTPDEQVNLTNTGFSAVSSSVDRSWNEARSSVNLPFVPQFEFPLNPSESENVSNYGAFRVNRFVSDNIPKPDRNFTVPPPNYRPLLDIKPSFDSVQGAIFNPPVHNPTFVSKDEIVNVVSEKPCDLTSSSRIVGNELKNLPESSKKDPVVDWVDENGDPLPGAFDYVKPNEERELNVENKRVEYVFSVKEKKDVPDDSDQPCFLNSGFLISKNVLHKNIAGNLGVPLGLPSGIVKKVVAEDEEKKLYEASKSGAAYKAAVQAITITASSSTADTSVNRVVPENKVAKKDRPPRFRRNRFADITKEDDQHDKPAEVTPQKSAEEANLENQAVTEILKEVQRGAARAKEMGALGWQKCPLPVTNKTFLRNTLVSTLREPYRPPSKLGRFHVGLKNNDDRGKHHKTRDDDRSSTSRSSRSRSSSRSHSSSYSRSRSGSSYTDDDDRSGSRDRRRHFSHRGRGSWDRGQHQYYDDAWAAYAAHYGYPWYGPEALPMFYGPEGWPVDPYAGMYYGDPQAWMEYEAYYGPPNFGPRGMGRGFRGRGRGNRGRGRGGYEGDFRGYNIGPRSHREYSRSHSRSGRSRSWSRDLSQSRSRSRAGSLEMRGRTHSTSKDRTQRQSRRHPRSKDKSLLGGSDEKTASGAETSEKKKKKKKKKKKHKKLKKLKHRQKDEDGKSSDKNAEESNDDAAESTNTADADDKEKPEEEKVESEDLVKKRYVAKLEKRKEHTKNKGTDKDENEDIKKIKDRKCDSSIRETVSDKGDMVRSTGDSKTVDEQIGNIRNEEHAFDVREGQKKGTRKQKEKTVHHRGGDNKYKGSSSQSSVGILTNEDLRITKLKNKTGGSYEDASSDKSLVYRKGDRTNDSRVNVIRDEMEADRDCRSSSQVKQDVVNRRRRCSSEFEEESRRPGGKYKYAEDRGDQMYDARVSYGNKDQRDKGREKVDRKGGSREGKGPPNVHSRGRDNSSGRPYEDSIKYKQRRGGMQSDQGESYNSGSSDEAERNSKEGHKCQHGVDVAGGNRNESKDSARMGRMIDNYKTRKDGRGEVHQDGKRPRIEGYKDGRGVRRDGRGESCDSGEGDIKEGGKQKVRRDMQGESMRSHSRGSQERVRKVDCIYGEGRVESSLVTRSSRQFENTIIRQTSKLDGNKYSEKDANSDIASRERKNNDSKERNKYPTKQEILQMDNREDSSERKTAGLNKNKDIHRKRQRSTSCDGDKVDDNFDKKQTERIINVPSVGNQRFKNKDNEKKENKMCEDKSGSLGNQSDRRVKSDQNRIENDEKHAMAKEMKESSFKKHRERKHDGRSREDEKEAAMEYKDGKALNLNTTESKIQQSSQRYEENSLPEKLKHKRVIKVTQVSKKSGATVNKTDIELKNQISSGDSNEHANVHEMQEHSDVTDRGGAVNKDEIEENTDKRPKGDGKGVKRKKKTVKKQVGAKKFKVSSVGGTTQGENLDTEASGEASETIKKQLKPEYALNKESEEKTVENSLDATLDSGK